MHNLVWFSKSFLMLNNSLFAEVQQERGEDDQLVCLKGIVVHFELESGSGEAGYLSLA